MRLALIQQHASDDVASNLRRGLDAAARAADAGAELIAFAELAFTPFYPQSPPTGDVLALAEPVPGPTTESFQRFAQDRGVVVVINLFERAAGCTYDSSPVIDADGTLLGRTRMVHILEAPCFHEQQYYTPGDLGAPVYQTRAGRVGVAICYDRHFPGYMRALALAAPISSSCHKPVSPMSGRPASSKARCARPRFKTATSLHCVIASVPNRA